MKRSAQSNPVTDRLAALSDPLRLRIGRLLDHQELSVGEVARVVQLPQSTVSRHLKVLAAAGWVQKRAEGTAMMYRLMLDDLAAEARTLWVTIREQLGDDDTLRPQVSEDHRRLQAVLAERRTDSQAFFGRVAGEWDQLRHDLFGTGFTALGLPALLPPSWVVADIGCGTGNAAELLAPHVRRVIAVDQSQPMLDAARKRLGRWDNIAFVRGEAEHLPIDDASVDAAVCVLLLHHLESPGAFFREMHRILRTDACGGVAVVIDMHEHDRTVYKQTMGHAHLGFAHERIAAYCADAGFQPPRITTLPSAADAKGPGLFTASAWLRPRKRAAQD